MSPQQGICRPQNLMKDIYPLFLKRLDFVFAKFELGLSLNLRVSYSIATGYTT